MVYDGVARCRPSAPGAKKKGKRLARNSVGTSFFFKSINTFFMCFFFTLPPPRPRSVTAIFRHTRDGQFSLSSAAEVLLLLLLLRRIPPLFYSAAVSFFLRPRAFRSPSVFSHAAIVRRRAEPSGFLFGAKRVHHSTNPFPPRPDRIPTGHTHTKTAEKSVNDGQL